MKSDYFYFDFPYKLRHRDGQDSLLVFLPSARTHHSWPYYPRAQWEEKFSPHFDVLYLSDPYQESAYAEKFGGSWFIDSDGNSKLWDVAESMRIAIEKGGYRKVVFYGSSLGGYASLVLASLIPGTIAIAECPQINLAKHAGAKFVLDNVQMTEKGAKLLDIFSLIEQNNATSKYKIVCNIGDHHFQAHVLPLLDAISKGDPTKFDIECISYFSGKYGSGHTALQYDDASQLIMRAADIFPNVL
ncbi:hypothetical protein ACNPPY_26945 [Achromobacter sp. AGC78]